MMSIRWLWVVAVGGGCGWWLWVVAQRERTPGASASERGFVELLRNQFSCLENMASAGRHLLVGNRRFVVADVGSVTEVHDLGDGLPFCRLIASNYDFLPSGVIGPGLPQRGFQFRGRQLPAAHEEPAVSVNIDEQVFGLHD